MLLTTFISAPLAPATHTGETTKRRLLNHHVLARLEDWLALFVMLRPPFDAAASTKQAGNVKGDWEQCSGGDWAKVLRAGWIGQQQTVPRHQLPLPLSIYNLGPPIGLVVIAS